MAEILLHIGYPKTGTTTLQRTVFRFLDCSAVPGRDNAIIRPLLRWVATGPETRVADDKIRHLESWITACPETPKVLSQEAILGLRARLTARPARFSSWAPARNLADSINRLGIRESDAHVVLTIRPQWQWLPSFFAQVPPGGDFRLWIERMLQLPPDSAKNPLNFHGVAKSFAEVVGRGNVHLLPLHLMGTRQYWEELTRGTSIDVNDLERIWALNGGPLNIRRSGESEWTSNPRSRLQGRLAGKLVDYPMLRRAAISKWNLPVRGISLVEGWAKPTPSVVLTPELRDRIIMIYADSNRQLSSEFELDLSSGQYW